MAATIYAYIASFGLTMALWLLAFPLSAALHQYRRGAGMTRRQLFFRELGERFMASALWCFSLAGATITTTKYPNGDRDYDQRDTS